MGKEVLVSDRYMLTPEEIKNAREVTLLEIRKTARYAAERVVVADVRQVNGERMRCGWLVEAYEKQATKLHVLLNWLNIASYREPLISERVYVAFLDSDLIGQLERAEFSDPEIQHKARVLYRRYVIFCEILDDEIRNMLAEMDVSDTIERMEAERLPDVSDDVVDKHTGSEV